MLNDRLPLSPAAVTSLLGRPDLWPVAVKAALELAPRGWWRRPPFLPLPEPEWLHFRLVTAYGGDGSTPMGADELLTWLEWKREFPH
ncbi:MAG: hypothetical protein R2710_15655 [Acidimicrobiales bacterium]